MKSQFSNLLLASVRCTALAVTIGASSAQVALQHFDGAANGNTANQFGFSCAAIGDVNGDAVTDFVVGAPFYATGTCPATQYDFGYAHIVSGADSSLILRLDGKNYGCSQCCTSGCTSGCGTARGGSRLGLQVCAVGDVNADGVPDYAIASDRDNPAGANSGAVRMHSGADHGVLWTSNGWAGSLYFGNAMAAIGDVNGDGVTDLAVGAPFDDQVNRPDCGSVSLVSGADGSALTTLYGTDAGAQMSICSRIGDVNGDGVDDVLVGARYENSGNLLKNGRVSVFSGAAPYALALVFDGVASNEELGYRVAGAGDVNGDGLPDILATSRGGASRVVHVFDTFGATLLDIVAPTGSVSFGESLAGVGDVDGDGRGDFAVSDPGFNGGEGIVYLYTRRLNGTLKLISTLPATGAEPAGAFGASVASIGHWDSQAGAFVDADFNGDGLDDVLVGATREYFNRGRVWIYSGVCLDPQNYCSSTPNSSGMAAEIGYQGSTSISANDFVLTASQCPADKSGLFYYGPLKLQKPFGCGIKCVGGNTVRLPLANTGATGALSQAVDNTIPPALGTLSIGAHWNFQFWFRDGGACPGSAVNFTDGLSAVFCP